MKKIFYLLLVLVVFGSCKKSSFESVFEKSPEERIADGIALVNSSLLSAPNGWIATLPTSAGGGYGFHMSFDDKQNVTMFSDISDIASTTPATSTYRVTTGLGAMLAFDTYNYLSVLQDPKATVYGGTQGSGFSSDVEFTYVRQNADSLFFVGRQYRQPLVMVKATAAQKASYVNGDYKTAMNKLKTFFATATFKYFEMTVGANIIKVGVSPNLLNTMAAGKRLAFGSTPAETFVGDAGSEKIAFTLTGVNILNAGLKYNGLTFVRMVWKDATTLAVYDSAGKEYIIKESATAVFYSSVTVADATTSPLWGPDFIARRAQANAATLAAANGIRLGKFTFRFTPATKRMDLAVGIFIGATAYADGILPYTYFKTDAGTYRFSTAGAPTGNGSFVSNEMGFITNQRLNVDTFNLTYITDPVSGAKMGQFKSVEHPDFYFAGTLL